MRKIRRATAVAVSALPGPVITEVFDLVPAGAQKAMATAVGGHVSTSPSGHRPMISRPADGTRTIESAAKGR